MRKFIYTYFVPYAGVWDMWLNMLPAILNLF